MDIKPKSKVKMDIKPKSKENRKITDLQQNQFLYSRSRALQNSSHIVMLRAETGLTANSNLLNRIKSNLSNSELRLVEYKKTVTTTQLK